MPRQDAHLLTPALLHKAHRTSGCAALIFEGVETLILQVRLRASVWERYWGFVSARGRSAINHWGSGRGAWHGVGVKAQHVPRGHGAPSTRALAITGDLVVT
jgi:hypothetical protein